MIDYHALKNQMVKYCYPLSCIDDLFDQLAGVSVFSSLDLTP